MILVTGATGFVGQKIMQMHKDAVACPSLRGATKEEVTRIVEESGADTIIHTAAIARMDICEQNPEESYHANVQIPVYLAEAAKGKKLICFSSDQVYADLDAEGPYSEDTVKTESVYGKHKLEMEQRVLDIDPDSVHLRAQWMYDYYLIRSNYFMRLIRTTDPVRYSARQFRGVTYVKEVSEQMANVMHLPGGVYNYGSETTKSIYEITKEFLARLGKDIEVVDVPPQHNLWVNCEKARKHGVVFRSVEDGLIACAKDYGYIK